MNPQEMIGMTGGGNCKKNNKLEKCNIITLREYAKKVKRADIEIPKI